MKHKGIIILVFLFLLFVFLRIPSLYEPYWHGDEGITLTVGQAINNGAVLYRDQADNKTPLLYFLASIFNSLPLFKFLLFLWMIPTIIFFYILCKLLSLKKGLYFSLLIFILLTSIPLLEGNIANGEIFFLLPNMLGMLFYCLSLKQNKNIFLLVSGIFFGLGFLFKPPAILDMGTVMFLLIISKQKFVDIIIKFLFLGLGFLIPNLIVLYYFFIHNSISYYIEYAYKWGFSYSSWNSSLVIPFGSQALKGLLLILYLTLIFIFRKKLSQTTVFVLSWLGFSIIASSISSRGYIHYLLQIVPSFSLILGIIYLKNKKILLLAILLICLVWNYLYPGSINYQYSYYKNYWEYYFGKKDIYSFRNFFDPRVNRTYKIAEFLELNKKGQIFIWGDEPLIYSLSRRTPVGRFSASYNIAGEEKRKKEAVDAINEKKPIYIIIVDPIKYPFPELDNIVKEDYNFLKRINDILIYERKS